MTLNVLKNNTKISIDNLNWSYGPVPILKDITANINPGSFTSIIGPNGSGKTTILKHILHLLPIPRKTIFLGAEDIRTLQRRDLAKKLGHVPQGERPDYAFTVEDFVMMGRYPHTDRFSLLTSDDHNAVYQALEMTGMILFKKHLITELSGGEYQRVLISRALAQEPEILVLDEPTSYLDPQHQLDILQLIRQLVNKNFVSVICVLHDLNSVIAFSDSVILIHNGEVFSMGHPSEVLTKEAIKKVYNLEVTIIPDPFTGKPFIIPDTRISNS